MKYLYWPYCRYNNTHHLCIMIMSTIIDNDCTSFTSYISIMYTTVNDKLCLLRKKAVNMSNVRWKKNRLLLAFIETGVQMCADFAVLSVFSLEDQILSYLRAKKNDKSTLGFYFRAATTWSAVLASSRVTFCHCNKDSWGGSLLTTHRSLHKISSEQMS